jgi:hypothetical protein
MHCEMDAGMSNDGTTAHVTPVAGWTGGDDSSSGSLSGAPVNDGRAPHSIYELFGTDAEASDSESALMRAAAQKSDPQAAAKRERNARKKRISKAMIALR